jgi:hypothetical protein
MRDPPSTVLYSRPSQDAWKVSDHSLSEGEVSVGQDGCDWFKDTHALSSGSLPCLNK